MKIVIDKHAPDLTEEEIAEIEERAIPEIEDNPDEFRRQMEGVQTVVIPEHEHRPVTDERALDLARRILAPEFTTEEAAIEIMVYATDAIAQERQHDATPPAPGAADRAAGDEGDDMDDFIRAVLADNNPRSDEPYATVAKWIRLIRLAYPAPEKGSTPTSQVRKQLEEIGMSPDDIVALLLKKAGMTN